MYREKIRLILAGKGFIGTDPRLVEAWMRDQYGTLDWLSPAQFEGAVFCGAGFVEDDHAHAAALADCVGL